MGESGQKKKRDAERPGGWREAVGEIRARYARLWHGTARMLRRFGWPAAGLLLLPVLWKLVPVFERSPLFAVSEIRVEGCERMKPQTVRSLIQAREGDSLLALDSERISRALENQVPILNASVIKRFPGELLIRIRERTPTALVRIRDSLFYLDLQGTVLYPVRPGDPLDLPLLTGLEERPWQFGRPDEGRMVHGALTLLRTLRKSTLPGRLSEIHVDPVAGMSFFLEGFPVKVRVGWKSFASRIERLEKVFPRLAADPQGVISVDLRFQGQVVVEKGEDAHKQISSRNRLFLREKRTGGKGTGDTEACIPCA
jgi:cell division septal protein FtsQ